MSAPGTESTPTASRAIGVCSWSLQPDSTADLVAKVRACGVENVQLALNPYVADPAALREAAASLRGAGIAIRSAMMQTKGEDYSSLASIARTGGVRPDEHWPTNLALARAEAALARDLGVTLVTFHAGFLPHETHDPERAKLVRRLREIVDVFAAQGVRVGFETGQESSATLVEFLAELDRSSAGVNFDPGNMILYRMGDPVEALRVLGPRVLQVHVKDARASERAGEWGEEVPVGTGDVAWNRFFDTLDAVAPRVDLMIEREAGTRRVEDVRTARALVVARVRGS